MARKKKRPASPQSSLEGLEEDFKELERDLARVRANLLEFLEQAVMSSGHVSKQLPKRKSERKTKIRRS